MRLFAIALTLLLFATPAFAAPPNYCVRVSTHTDDDGILDSHGSGVMLSNMYMITNAHVVKGAKKLYVMYNDWAYVRGRIVKTDKIRDLALVRVPNTLRKGCPVAKKSCVGQSVVIGGYGQGIWQIGEGKIVQTYHARPKLKDTFIWIKGYAARPGDSGGFILCDGELVGINMTTNGISTGGVRIEEIKQFTKGHIKWPKN